MKIKFLTLNIFNGNYLDRCLDFLVKENAEVMVLQEVYSCTNQDLKAKHRSLQILQEKFKDYQSFYTPSFFKLVDGIKVDSGNVIFSRHPILDKAAWFYFGGYRERPVEIPAEFRTSPCHLQYAKIKTGDGFLAVFNTHGIWGTDGKDDEERLKMSEFITSKIKDQKNAVLAGDFNVQPETRTIKNLEKYLVNIFGNELKSTFNVGIKEDTIKNKTHYWKKEDLAGFSSAVVDHVFIAKDLRLVDHYVPQVDVSDHRPLVVSLDV